MCANAYLLFSEFEQQLTSWKWWENDESEENWTPKTNNPIIVIFLTRYVLQVRQPSPFSVWKLVWHLSILLRVLFRLFFLFSLESLVKCLHTTNWTNVRSEKRVFFSWNQTKKSRANFCFFFFFLFCFNLLFVNCSFACFRCCRTRSILLLFLFTLFWKISIVTTQQWCDFVLSDVKLKAKEKRNKTANRVSTRKKIENASNAIDVSAELDGKRRLSFFQISNWIFDWPN